MHLWITQKERKNNEAMREDEISAKELNNIGFNGYR